MGYSEGMNPYQSGDAVTGDLFTDRADLVKRLREAMLNHQNVVLIGPRRYGKSSVVREAQGKAKRQGGRVAFANLANCNTREDVVEVLANAIMRDALSWLKGSLDALRERVGRTGIGLDIHPTMEGAFALKLIGEKKPPEFKQSVGTLVRLLAEAAASEGKPAALLIDEVQRVLEIEEGMPGTIKMIVDEVPSVSYVMCGSQRKLMESLVIGEDAPWLGIGDLILVGTIDRTPMVRFLRDRCEFGSKSMDPGVAEEIYDAGRGVPYYIQQLAYHAFAQADREVTRAAVEAGLRVLETDQGSWYQALAGRINTSQRRVLAALAVEPTATPYDRDYIHGHRLPSTSTVQSSLASLEKTELVEQGPGGVWRLANPFLEGWLQRQAV